MTDAQLKTLNTGIDVLVLLSQAPRSASDIGGALALNKAAVFRFLTTLQARGLVSRDVGGLYALTPKLWELGLGAMNRGRMRMSAAAAVQMLSESIGETVHLSIYDAGEVLYVDKADGSHPITAYTKLGGRAPAYCVSTGKALLGAQPRFEIDRVLGSDLVRYTPATIVEPARLRPELEEIVKNGFAVNRGEWRADVGGLAVVLCEETGHVWAALGVSGPVNRILDRQAEYLTALKEAKRAAETAED